MSWFYIPVFRLQVSDTKKAWSCLQTWSSMLALHNSLKLWHQKGTCACEVRWFLSSLQSLIAGLSSAHTRRSRFCCESNSVGLGQCSIVECVRHSSNGKIIISALSELLCNNTYSALGTPLGRQMICVCVCWVGKVTPDWSSRLIHHQRVTEGCPEARPIAGAACLPCTRRQTQTKTIFLSQESTLFWMKGMYRLDTHLLERVTI